MKYQEESLGQWSLMGLVHYQYSQFDLLRIWHKDSPQETYWSLKKI
jgi:hypothetical protein